MYSLIQIELFSKKYFVQKDFYENAMGFKIVFENTEKTHVIFESKGCQLVLKKHIKEVENKIRLGFQVENLKSTRAFLTANNVAVSPLKMVEGKQCVDIKDPDGNDISIFQK